VRLNDKRGFTLIELMLTVVIVAILAAMAIPRFMPASTRAKQKEAQTLLKQIYVMQRAYFQEYDTYTNNLADLGIELMPGTRYNYTIQVTGTAFTATANAPDPGVDDDPTPDTWTIDNLGTLQAVSNDVTS
jgi:prepilin-type N-terminal cleavage/methylation domain-containing protein